MSATKDEAPVIGPTEASVSTLTSHGKNVMTNFNSSTPSLAMAGSSQAVTPESLPAITWNQARVVTTELLARLYGTGTSNIHDNYRNNIDRFEEGKHFFKLEGEKLRQFKTTVTGIFPVSRIRNLVLWTERGAARHAKMLETNAAWEVFEKLEDCYFSVKAAMAAAPYTAQTGDTLNSSQTQTLRDMLDSAVRRLPHANQAAFMQKGWGKLKSHFGVSYRQIPAEQFTDALSIVARHAADWEVLDAPKKYNFPLEAADPHARWLQNAWITPRVLMDPQNRALELELIAQLEKDGHDVTGVKVRILAMRQALEQIEQLKHDMRSMKERLGPIVEIIDVGLAERGMNVNFGGVMTQKQARASTGA